MKIVRRAFPIFGLEVFDKFEWSKAGKTVKEIQCFSDPLIHVLSCQLHKSTFEDLIVKFILDILAFHLFGDYHCLQHKLYLFLPKLQVFDFSTLRVISLLFTSKISHLQNIFLLGLFVC